MARIARCLLLFNKPIDYRLGKIKKTECTPSFRGAVKTLSGSNYAAKIQHFFSPRNAFPKKNLSTTRRRLFKKNLLLIIYIREKTLFLPFRNSKSK